MSQESLEVVNRAPAPLRDGRPWSVAAPGLIW